MLRSNGGGDFEVVTKDSSDGLEVLRHSTAHAMAQAILELYPGSKLTLGPPIENGFFYDIEVAGRITDEDLPRIEERMREIVARDLPIRARGGLQSRGRGPLRRTTRTRRRSSTTSKTATSRSTAREISSTFAVVRTSRARAGSAPSSCRTSLAPTGGATRRTRCLPASTARPGRRRRSSRLTSGGSRRREPGTTARSARTWSSLRSRRIRAPASRSSCPKGEMMRHLMEDYVREVQTRHGYEHVWTGHLVNEDLYAKSGHLEHYRESMFPPMVDGETRYRLKPMNCPSHMTLYNSRAHSYRDLPLRYAEFATLYRYEKSGELTGSPGCAPSRRTTPTSSARRIRSRRSSPGRWRSSARSSIPTGSPTTGSSSLCATRTSAKYVADDAKWSRAEKELREALDTAGIAYDEEAGEAAFYGPKADFMAKDVLGREWQLSTIQVDFIQPGRLDASTSARTARRIRRCFLHRAVTGSTERFMAVVIEHYAGAFPVWLSPVQAVVIPVADRHLDYAREVQGELAEKDLRVEVDDSQNSMQKKIRDNARQKIPYLLIVGDREAERGHASTCAGAGRSSRRRWTSSEFAERACSRRGQPQSPS